MGRRSYEGAKVRLRRDITTRGGVTFKAGVIMRVDGKDSSGWWLSCLKRGWHHRVSGIDGHSFTVVEYADRESDQEEPKLKEKEADE